MILIFEGPDCVGKTTAMKTIAERLTMRGDSVVMQHRGQPTTMSPLFEYTVGIDQHRGGHHILCDRWHIGELVYGPLLRQQCLLTDKALVAIDEYLRQCGALIVFMNDHVSNIVSRLEDRGDDLIDADLIEEIVHTYERVFETMPITTRVMRVNGPARTDQIINEIITRGERAYAAHN